MAFPRQESAAPLYQSSDLATFRARSRSNSLSSTSTLYDGTSSSSSSHTTLDSFDVRSIFSSVKNVTIGDNTWGSPPKTSTVKLEFGVRPAALRAQARKSSLAAIDDKLNPKAAPFVPGGRSMPTTPQDVPSYTSPGALDGPLLPPGLPAPFEHPAWPTYPVESPQAITPEAFDTYYDPAPPPPQHWSFYFEAGTSHDAIANDYVRDSNAMAAVTCNTHWADDEMMFFASHFPGKVYSSTNSSEYPVAPFAFSVYQAFESTQGPMEAQRFLLALRQHTMNAFMNSWSQESFHPEVHTSLEAGLTGHVFASLYLAKFVGDLFNVGLLPKSHVQSCISFLLSSEPRSEEHIVALGHLVIQAGPEFWLLEPSPMAEGSSPMVLDAKEFNDFVQKYSDAARGTRGSLIERNQRPCGYSAQWVGFVREYFAEWEAAYAEYFAIDS